MNEDEDFEVGMDVESFKSGIISIMFPNIEDDEEIEFDDFE